MLIFVRTLDTVLELVMRPMLDKITSLVSAYGGDMYRTRAGRRLTGRESANRANDAILRAGHPVLRFCRLAGRVRSTPPVLAKSRRPGPMHRVKVALTATRALGER